MSSSVARYTNACAHDTILARRAHCIALPLFLYPHERSFPMSYLLAVIAFALVVFAVQLYTYSVKHPKKSPDETVAAGSDQPLLEQ